MSVYLTVTASDRDNDGDSVTFHELDEAAIDREKDAREQGALPDAAIVKVTCEGNPYLTADDLIVLAEQLRELHQKVTRGRVSSGPFGGARVTS